MSRTLDLSNIDQQFFLYSVQWGAFCNPWQFCLDSFLDELCSSLSPLELNCSHSLLQQYWFSAFCSICQTFTLQPPTQSHSVCQYIDVWHFFYIIIALSLLYCSLVFNFRWYYWQFSESIKIKAFVKIFYFCSVRENTWNKMEEAVICSKCVTCIFSRLTVRYVNPPPSNKFISFAHRLLACLALFTGKDCGTTPPWGAKEEIWEGDETIVSSPRNGFVPLKTRQESWQSLAPVPLLVKCSA